MSDGKFFGVLELWDFIFSETKGLNWSDDDDDEGGKGFSISSEGRQDFWLRLKKKKKRIIYHFSLPLHSCMNLVPT